MIECTRRLQFCAGHRLVDHEGVCANVHGHNYVVYITARRKLSVDTTDRIGRVIDFSLLKKRVGAWLDHNWDHGFILNDIDYDLKNFLAAANYPVYVMSGNPTAENMAQHLLEVCNYDLFGGDQITITKIVLWETENCCAEVTTCPEST